MRRGIALALLLSACASTEQAGEAMRAGWVGKPADAFFAQHGAAEEDQRLSDGRHVYIWKTSTMAGAGRIRVWCSADILASAAGIITDIRPREDSIGRWNTSRCAEVFR